MSVIVKGMEMPMCCDECPMFYEYRFCELTDDHASSIEWKTEEKRMPNCPLIELPDHGDLIDRNMLIGGFADWYIQESPMYLEDSKVVAETIGDAMKAIEAAPVVIQAERREE